MSKLLVIDGNNLAHRAYNKYSNFYSSKGQCTSIIYGLPYMLRGLISKFKPTDVVVVFDGGKDPVRKKLHPDYKAKRTEKRKDDFNYDDFTKQKDIAEKILKTLGVQVVRKRHVEADDLIWLYSRRYTRLKSGKVIIVSTDKDFHQLLKPDGSIQQWHPWKDMLLHYKHIYSEYGYYPEECVDWLSIVGDKSDNIPGLRGVGDKGMRKFLDKYGSVLNYIKNEDIPEDSSKKLSKKNIEQAWLLYRQLVDIRLHCRRHLKNKYKIKFTKKQPNRKKLAILCGKYSLTLFLKKNFIQTFNY